MNALRRVDERLASFRAGERNEDGSALIEFVGASIILLIPLLYLLVSVFQVQRGAFAASEAAREAGRAFATAPSSEVGVQRANYAAQLAFADQGIDDQPVVRFVAPGAGCADSTPDVVPVLAPGASYTVCVGRAIYLPYADKGFLAHAVRARVQVTGKYALSVDRFRSAG
jgi:hypothetical protein